MQIIYAREKFPDTWSKSIFLAGPTPRSGKVSSWRPEALRILEAKGYDGLVFVPEDRDGTSYENFDYKEQVDWEYEGLHKADVISFWIPRNLKTLPGFTTNVEFGLWAHFGNIVLGSPDDAAKNRYLQFIAEKLFVPQADTLEKTIDISLAQIGEGALRSGGEREIPMYIWRLRAFQNWHQAQKKAGNRLDGASLQWISRVRNKPEAIFVFGLHPNVHITGENRNKLNEPIVSRLDISSIILYMPAPKWQDTKIVLIREFRSAGATDDGYIWELPGGSSPHLTDPLAVAHEEVSEEVNMDIAKDRFRFYGVRQLAGTLSTHKAHIFSVELNQKELAIIIGQKGIAHGSDLDNPTGERAYSEVKTIREILSDNLLDWSNIGMVLSAIRPE